MTRNLLLAGGISHPFEATSAWLAERLAGEGIATRVFLDIEAGLAELARSDYDLLTVNALRWTMVQHEKYAPDRPRWAFSLSQAGRQAIRGHVAHGGGVLGLHTAAICFDDWPEWKDILGVGWRWGRSHHPPLGRLVVHMTDQTHPISRGIGDFSVDDELYTDLDVAAGVRVLGEAKLAASDPWRPVAFAYEAPAGRRAYLALGHDVASLSLPQNSALIGRAARWSAGLPLSENAPSRGAMA